MSRQFIIKSTYQPAGEQPQAIKKLVDGVKAGLDSQVLLGVTGSGKTFTIANVIAELNRPALIIAHNKTLAAQLYGEMKSFFPHNAVEYFVSYYDYYQPEAYVPASDTFIEKDSSINDHIEQMRLSATKSLLDRKDTIIVASVSAIYGLAAPESYLKMILPLKVGDITDSRKIIKKLTELQYTRNNSILERGTFRVRGENIDIYPADSDHYAIRIELFDDEIEKLYSFDPLTGKVEEELIRYTIFPKTHYATPRENILQSVEKIKAELKIRHQYLLDNNKLIEAQRLKERTLFDIEMMLEIGHCSGIENYSSYLSNRQPDEAPSTLLDYLPQDGLLFIDESHATIGQIAAMYKGDRSRKSNLVEYGFRLPSALDNRPLKFDEFEKKSPQTIFLSATPAEYEINKSNHTIIEQVIRPTGLLDPIIEVRPAITQVDDVLEQIHKTIAKNNKILITTLTKKMAEDLTDFLSEHNVRVRYLHSDIDTVERMEIIRELRSNVFDVLIGINLLREGLDIPEVSLVAILDADKEGFLRSERALIQTIGRAARNIEGRAILYADRVTNAMQSAINETERRREKQHAYNVEHNITPMSLSKQVKDIMDLNKKIDNDAKEEKIIDTSTDQNIMSIEALEKEMIDAAHHLEFEKAALLRDKIKKLEKNKLF